MLLYRQRGFSLILIAVILSFTMLISAIMFFYWYLSMDSAILARRQLYQRIALDNLETEAYCWLVSEFNKSDGQRRYNSTKYPSIQSLDHLLLKDFPGSSNGVVGHVRIYDLSFDVASLDKNLTLTWGHREQDFYPPMPGAYLIRAVIKPDDEYSSIKLLETVYAIDGNSNKLERKPRLKNEIWQTQ